ncbi:MAG: thiol:disulfide interchange protein DsbA [Wenzhouxiangellaceae bacterium]
MRVLLLSAFLAITPLLAQAQNGSSWQEGVHYHLIDQASAPSGDEIVVEEVFSYACPHCNSFQPFVGQWHANLPEDVEFKRIPAIFSRSWEPFARAYLTLDAMGMIEQGHQPLFDALHKEHKRLRTIEDIAGFLATQGIDEQQFLSTAQSFAVNGRINQVQTQTRRYGISGTPSLVVDGKYRIAAGGPLNSYNDMLEVADYLVAQQRQARQQLAASE